MATPRDLLNLAVHSASPQLWHDLKTLYDQRGWPVVDNLVLNADYVTDGAIENVAHALAKAPDVAGGEALVLSASTGASYTEAYALQFAAEDSADIYMQNYSVTYTPVTAFATDGSPVFGQPRTEPLVIPVEAYLRQWFFTQSAPIGPSDLRGWNTIMKLKAAIAAGLRDHVTFWAAGGVDPALQTWTAANVPAIFMTVYHDDGLR